MANNIAFTRMVNKAGTTVTANAESLTSAMNDFADKFTDKLTNTIVDGPAMAPGRSQATPTCAAHHQHDGLHQGAEAAGIYPLVPDRPHRRQDGLRPGLLRAAGCVQKQVLAKLATVTCNGNPVLK